MGTLGTSSQTHSYGTNKRADWDRIFRDQTDNGNKQTVRLPKPNKIKPDEPVHRDQELKGK